MLSQAEIDSFVAQGFVAIRGAVPADVLLACQEEIWSALSDRGVLREDPSTWRDPVVRIPCPESDAFAAAGTQPLLWEAFDQLIGAGRWWRRRGVGGTIPVRFPSRTDPGDAGWHIESSYAKDGQPWVNYRSRARGLLALYLFSDVDNDSAPTRIRPGSHRDAARILAPAGDEGMPFAQAAQLAAQASAVRPTALVTGRAGDVFVCHPFLVHAASWPHVGRNPRIIAQPGVALHDAFPLVRPLSPVELAMEALTLKVAVLTDTGLLPAGLARPSGWPFRSRQPRSGHRIVGLWMTRSRRETASCLTRRGCWNGGCSPPVSSASRPPGWSMPCAATRTMTAGSAMPWSRTRAARPAARLCRGRLPGARRGGHRRPRHGDQGV